MDPLFGDDLDAPAAWKGGGDLSRLNGVPIRLRFILKDADLFSIRLEMPEARPGLLRLPS